jgi:hypothetical protein
MEGVIKWKIDAEISRRLDALANAERATFFTINLAIFTALMADETKRSDVIVGTNFTSRYRAELQTMVGDLGNLATLRISCPRERTFRRWLAEVRSRVSETEVRADIPYGLLRQEMEERGSTLPHISLMLLQVHARETEKFGGLELAWLDRRTEVMPWGFAVEGERRADGSWLHARFDANSYRPDDVRRFLRRYYRLFDAVSKNPDMTVGELLSLTRERGWPAQLREAILGRWSRNVSAAKSVAELASDVALPPQLR